ncbi:hypothetical protein TNCV_4236321 [Trichonephila clavipes]|nr:hypothetical protein TNCV_4236321 [Trichonephila clavipes]
MSTGEVSVECRIQDVDESKGNGTNDTLTEPNASSSTKAPLKKTAKDFRFGKLIGEGSFSMVYLAKDIHSNKEYAIKVCDKRHILREKKQKAIMREKQILNILNNHPSPFFIKLYCTFQDADRLCILFIV